MKKPRHMAEQVAFALRQAESGTQMPEVCRKMGISERTFCRACPVGHVLTLSSYIQELVLNGEPPTPSFDRKRQ